MEDFNIVRKLQIKTDASVAKSVATRRGAGKIRHVEVNQLWLQEKVQKGIIDIVKVGTKDNLADLLTKHQDSSSIDSHLVGVRCRVSSDRHVDMPKLASDAEEVECPH